MPDVWITTGKAASMLGISASTLRRRAKEWGFTVRIGRSGFRYFRLSEILKAGGSYELAEKAKEERRQKRKQKALELLRQELEERKRRMRLD